MNVNEKLDLFKKKVLLDEKLKNKVLQTKNENNSLTLFCELARDNGIEIYPIDVINAGEEFYATMRRSTNGGGENSPKLEYEDDLYEMFIAEIIV